jgi:serine/threonine-protein kinase
MSGTRTALLEELFERFAGQPESQQQSLVEAACGGDRALAEELLALLRADANGGHPALDRNVAALAQQLLEDDGSPPCPHSFGPYTLRQYLDHGGMGWVYLAERSGLGDVVAIKFLRDAWSSPARRARFAREQRLLANLNHPHIARLYDAGVVNGTPWFAMEYVRGRPITTYCEQEKLGLHGRLKLFRAACEAVQYAHRNLTVHLDLKPSNILVSTDGQVKLLDFGIAKSLDVSGNEAEKTKTGLRLFSLNYAAPEQIRGDALDIQTDVHGLGVVLYELLTGRTPADLTNASATELARFTETEVPRPSAVVHREARCGVHASKAEWHDLDAICSAALHRDRARRYETVGALIRDIDHFLRNETLEAQSDSVRYRLGKFVSRHRRAVGAAAAVLGLVLALCVFFTARLIEARDRALSSEARMQRIHRLMMNLFEGDDNAAGPAEGLRVVQLLDRGVKEAASLNSEPDLQSELRFTLGVLYHKLGRPDRAEPLLRAALSGQVALGEPKKVEARMTRLALALLHIEQSRLAEAEVLINQALTDAKRRRSPAAMEVARVEAAQGKLLVTRGQYTEAVPLLEATVKTLSAAPESVEFSEALGSLANAYYYMGDLEKSEEINRQALQLDRKLFGAHHPHVAVDLYNLGNIQLDHGRYREGEQLFHRALEISRAWYGDAHPKTASNLLMLGRAAGYQGRVEEAAGRYRQALDIRKAAYGERNVRVAAVLNHMGDLARDRGELRDAERLFRRAAGIFRTTVGDQHEFYAHQLSNLGSVYVAAGQFQRAEKVLRQAVHQLRRTVPGQRYTGLACVRLAAALSGQGRYQEAERHALAGYRILEKQTSMPALELRQAQEQLVSISQALRGL